MFNERKSLALLIAILLINLPLLSAAKKADKTGEITRDGATPALWREPEDIAARNLFYGPGGEKDQPHPPFTFVEEDLSGTNPKFDVRDRDGVKWRVKLGAEAKPETAATRLVWAAGYFANEDYFLPELRVSNMPHLSRGNKFIETDGSMRNVRLKRHLEGEKKIGNWKWRDNTFSGTQELNGLRVMMAVINNWDLKDENNAIYSLKHGGDGSKKVVYMISDLGASFGTTYFTPNHEKAKGNLNSFLHSRFIRTLDNDLISFDDPHRPATIVIANPHEFISRLNLEWIGRNIPAADARWIGQWLGKLTPDQIRDAFRAAGYAPDEVETFAAEVQLRIADLKNL